jgi:hypothetical protein
LTVTSSADVGMRVFERTADDERVIGSD